MSRKSKEVAEEAAPEVEEEVAEEAAPEVEEKKIKKGDATEAVVIDTRGGEVRVYSKDKNGEDFAALADEFVSNPKRKGYRVELR